METNTRSRLICHSLLDLRALATMADPTVILKATWDSNHDSNATLDLRIENREKKKSI